MPCLSPLITMLGLTSSAYASFIDNTIVWTYIPEIMNMNISIFIKRLKKITFFVLKFGEFIT